ncbi:MAG: carbamate kinase [Candidatus Acidoferrales bacterium]
MPTAVVAIGGNSLLRPGERGTIEEQRRNLKTTCEGIAAVVAGGYGVVITHGNGPQVGAALLRSEAAADQVPPLPLDVCDAETQGSIGYLLQQTLQNTLGRRGLTQTVVTMVTQVLVALRDPAFRAPTKPVGPFYTRAQAEDHRARLKWQMVEDAKRGYRRVVPSPEPRAIVELLPIQRTLESGALVIACGGGGIPVILHDCQLVGVEAVIDKDRVSALLASQLGADLLLISTGVDEVALNFGTPEQRPLSRLTAAEAKRYLQEGQFPPGSMGPKIEAALSYLEHGGREVIITSPEKIPAALRGKAGTRIAPQLEPATRPT